MDARIRVPFGRGADIRPRRPGSAQDRLSGVETGARLARMPTSPSSLLRPWIRALCL